jgi:hypothetical protein
MLNTFTTDSEGKMTLSRVVLLLQTSNQGVAVSFNSTETLDANRFRSLWLKAVFTPHAAQNWSRHEMSGMYGYNGG